MPEKPLRPSDVFARQLKAAREHHRPRLTTKALAARLKDLGFQLDPAAITRIEQGDRKITVDEWLLFAAALDVPPPLLLLPLAEIRVAITTTKDVIHPYEAMRWFVGKEPLATGDVRNWKDAAKPLELYRKFEIAQENAQTAETSLRKAEWAKANYPDEDDRTSIAEHASVFHDMLQELSYVLAEMRQAGIKPPRLPREWMQKMRELGRDSGRAR